MNLLMQISLCGLFLLVVNACDDLDEPVLVVPHVPQLPRKEINNSLISIISEECPEDFVEKFNEMVTEIRSLHRAKELDISDNISDYSRESAKYYAQNDLLTIQSYRPPSASPRYLYSELVFRKSQLFSSEYATGEKLIATQKEILDSWMHKPNGLLASYEYDLYGSEPVDADAEKWEYFTHLVWRNTTGIGLACVTSIRNFTLDSNIGVEDTLNKTTTKIVLNVVANLGHRSNMECKYRQNVLPPRNSTKKEHKELFRLLKKEKLEPTHECQSREEFDRDMTKCPEAFEKSLLELFNRKRKARGGNPLQIDHSNLGEYSQNFVNRLVGQSHEVIGNEPNSIHGGDILWWPNVETVGQQHSIKVRPGEFMEDMIIQETTFKRSKLLGKELKPEVAEKYKDFTRIVWKNTQRVGFGCGLSWLPGQNITRPIVVVNFAPFGNVPGHYIDNVLKETENEELNDDADLNKDENTLGGPRENEPDTETSPALPEIEQEVEPFEFE